MYLYFDAAIIGKQLLANLLQFPIQVVYIRDPEEDFKVLIANEFCLSFLLLNIMRDLSFFLYILPDPLSSITRRCPLIVHSKLQDESLQVTTSKLP